MSLDRLPRPLPQAEGAFRPPLPLAGGVEGGESPLANPPYIYAIGLGSNRCHPRHGRPPDIIAAALATLEPLRQSPIRHSRPIGPSRRTFANAAALVESDLPPSALLVRLKAIEHWFGRRHGQRWGARVLDLDILLWSGGRWATRTLAIPHLYLLRRRFALEPLAEIAPGWRIPRHGTVRQHVARLTRPSPVHRSGRRSGP